MNSGEQKFQTHIEWSKQKRKNLQETLAIAAGGLQVGEQTRKITCPSCEGGVTREKSFSLRKDPARILFNCWRASCGFKGIIDYNGAFIEDGREEMSRALKPARIFMGALSPFGVAGINLFDSKFSMTVQDLTEGGVQFAREEDRYAFPVLSPHHGKRGLTLRDFNTRPTTYPKWDAFPSYANHTWLGWYIRTVLMEGSVVVVEDPISALKVSRHFKACFLNGTNLDFEKLLEIDKVASGKGIILALDKDATSKAIELLRSYQFFIGSTATCIHLEKDAKYMSSEEIKEAFSLQG